jgi:hypothetical protein
MLGHERIDPHNDALNKLFRLDACARIKIKVPLSSEVQQMAVEQLMWFTGWS